MWFVYILECSDGSLYTGISNDLEKRFAEHKTGKGGRYTRSHKPIRLVYSEKMVNHSKALKKEAQIKSWSRKKKIKFLELKFTP